MLGTGLQITSDGVKAAIVEKIEDKYIIKKIFSTKFESEIINNGTIELKDQFVSTLGKFAISNSLIRKKISLNYFNQKVNFRNFSIPIMGEKDIKKAVQWQISEDLGMPLDDLVYDYSMSGMEDGKYNIIAIVAKKKEVSQYMALVSEAGLNIGIIDLPNTSSIYPMSRELFTKNGYTVVMDINDFDMNISFLVNDNISFMKNTNIGFVRLLDGLSKETPYKFEEIVKDSQLLKKYMPRFEDFYAAVTGELQNSIWFYESNFIKGRSIGNIKLKNLVLNQHASTLPEFKNYIHNVPILSESFVTEWLPEEKMFEYDRKEVNWAKDNIAIGLAMRCAEND